MITKAWPSCTARPSAQRTSRTKPLEGAQTAISIFINSTMIRVSPALTSRPGSTRIFHTLPGTGLSTAVAPKGNAPSSSKSAISSPAAPLSPGRVSCQRARSASKAAC